MVRGGPTLLVAHNAQFDGEFTRYLLAGQSFPDGLHWLDSMTVYKDRRPYPHRLESAIRAYGLEGKVQNSHRAIDDTMALYEVLKAMEQERDDLYRYIDLFGYNPKYGAPKHRWQRLNTWRNQDIDIAALQANAIFFLLVSLKVRQRK